jgi:phospholipase C
MNGFDLMGSCRAELGYRCFQAFEPDQIPSLAALARAFVISDRTFQTETVPTFGAHVSLVSSQLDGFLGDNPILPGHETGPGWGCDSKKDALWQAAHADPFVYVPSCIPEQDGSGPYRASPVQWVPTIMSRLDQAGLPWKIYSTQPGAAGGYNWATCPFFADCFYGPERANWNAQAQFFTDAAAGNLPAVSFVLPEIGVSQHNQISMMAGDDWIGQLVSAAMSAPTWDSTAIFITYDDCGCFYDHVTPPPNMGIRSPMVIVSPYAKPGFTDSMVASYASMLTFIEHNFGLDPLSRADADAYDYADSINLAQEPLPPIELPNHPVPRSSLRWLRAHPYDDWDDPT